VDMTPEQAAHPRMPVDDRRGGEEAQGREADSIELNCESNSPTRVAVGSRSRH
jgi:hypothetical protein